MLQTIPSTRAEAVTRRTYNRPLDETGNRLETWDQTVQRATFNQHFRLWNEAGHPPDELELEELRDIVQAREALVSGRTLWLGGTEYSGSRACSQFNCSFVNCATVYDAVDIFWLLLNGCGVGFKPVPGTLHGFLRPILALDIIGSLQGPNYRGNPSNFETLPCEDNGYEWIIKVGDSAEAWAKSLGKLLNPPKCAVKKLTIDFSDVRGPGGRLKGYGWICNGSKPLEIAYSKIFDLMNAKAGDLLDEMDLLDLVNHLGTVLSSRRSAQIALMDHKHPRWQEFSYAKQNFWVCKSCGSHNTSKGVCRDCKQHNTNHHRQQSNNSLVFWHKPSKPEIRDLMTMIWECGGSEPGFINGYAARNRAPWFNGLNPCAEILLPSRGFCNLVTTVVPRFKGNFAGLLRTLHVMSRANYRQTCVDLRDGLLSPEWHQTNESLRLCGVSLTGLAQAPWLTDYQIKTMRNTAVAGAYSMADELGLPRPKLVTTIKPEGTGSKCCDTTEGIHKPLGRFIFNWINFASLSPLVGALAAAGYRVIDNPSDPNGTLVCFPVDFTGCRFDMVNGKHVNLDSAVHQLFNYRRWNTLWADHNVSNTISWDIEELDDIVDWLDHHWDDFVAVSWLKRTDPTKTAADLGYPYLPQEVVGMDDYMRYTSTLTKVQWPDEGILDDSEMSECASGQCPIK
jgi:ribonucleoside-triphosphate reductase (formate)